MHTGFGSLDGQDKISDPYHQYPRYCNKPKATAFGIQRHKIIIALDVEHQLKQSLHMLNMLIIPELSYKPFSHKQHQHVPG